VSPVGRKVLLTKKKKKKRKVARVFETPGKKDWDWPPELVFQEKKKREVEKSSSVAYGNKTNWRAERGKKKKKGGGLGEILT